MVNPGASIPWPDIIRRLPQMGMGPPQAYADHLPGIGPESCRIRHRPRVRPGDTAAFISLRQSQMDSHWASVARNGSNWLAS